MSLVKRLISNMLSVFAAIFIGSLIAFVWVVDGLTKIVKEIIN